MKNKFTDLLFNNEIFFPKHKIPLKVTFGDYLGFLVVSTIRIWSGAIFLAVFVIGVDILLNLITKNNGTNPIYYIEEGTINHSIVVFLAVICSIYFLFALLYNIFLSFNYLTRVFSSSPYKNVKKEYDIKIKNINDDLKKELIDSTLNNSAFNFENEFYARKEIVKSQMKKEFLKKELNKIKNIQEYNIENEKKKIDDLFEFLIK